MVMMVIATPIIVMVLVAELPAGGGGVSQVVVVPVRGVPLGPARTGLVMAIVVTAVHGIAADAVANGGGIRTVGVGAVGGANEEEGFDIVPIPPNRPGAAAAPVDANRRDATAVDEPGPSDPTESAPHARPCLGLCETMHAGANVADQAEQGTPTARSKVREAKAGPEHRNTAK